ncbi:MAG: acyl-CoA dehydrogenase family protein [Elusimicrobia bacterium]|nr:acyl-CoA dehydrogenase family protein [Elusimicrobiota bacterium]
MDFDFPNPVKIVQRTARDFARQAVAPLVKGMEENGRFPKPLIKQMAEVGLLGLVTPRKYGGSELGFLARTVAIQEISKVSAAVGLSLQVHHMQSAALVDWGSKEQKEKYLPRLCRGEFLGTCAITEPTGGSDLLGMASAAKPAQGGYSLTGSKCFITNAHLGGAPLVVVKTGEGSRGLSAFIIDRGTPGFSVGREERKLGLWGANTGELFFKNCRIPEANLVGDEGEGMKVALKTIGEAGRPGMAAIALGIVEASLEEAVKFSKGRTLYGKPISNLQAIQWGLADILMDFETAKLLCYRASWLKDKGRDCATHMTMAKVYATEAAVRASRRALEIHGGCGTMMEYPVQRLFRDAMVCVSAGGTTEIGKIVMSRAVLS